MTTHRTGDGTGVIQLANDRATITCRDCDTSALDQTLYNAEAHVRETGHRVTFVYEIATLIIPETDNETLSLL